MAHAQPLCPPPDTCQNPVPPRAPRPAARYKAVSTFFPFRHPYNPLLSLPSPLPMTPALHLPTNLTALTAFPPPVAPDLGYCGMRLVPRPRMEDCWAAFDWFPEGDEPIEW